MKSKLIIAVLLLCTQLGFSQEDKGIQFVHEDSWKAVLAKAKAENKYIFMDAFTTWCGPCKAMARNIFPLPEVGSFYNDKFINVKVQLDTSAKDDDYIKNWYADAHAIQTNYKVNAYPTYLFFSPDGKLVHRAVGSSEAPVFIAKGKDALDPNKQYFTLVDRYTAGERDPEFLKALAEAADNAYDREMTPVYAKAYLSTQKNLLSEDNIRFLDLFTQTTSDEGFKIIAEHTAAYDKVMGKGMADEKIKAIVLNEVVYPKLFTTSDKPDWAKLEKSLAKDYPRLAGEIADQAKVAYYNNNGDWPEFSKAVTSYLVKYGDKAAAKDLNNYAWQIFENCDDAACIGQALAWSKNSVERTNDPMFIDTYANLLYKGGNKELAVQWEEKAINIVKEKNEEDLSTYESTLEKMKKGEKTWE